MPLVGIVTSKKSDGTDDLASGALPLPNVA